MIRKVYWLIFAALLLLVLQAMQKTAASRSLQAYDQSERPLKPTQIPTPEPTVEAPTQFGSISAELEFQVELMVLEDVNAVTIVNRNDAPMEGEVYVSHTEIPEGCDLSVRQAAGLAKSIGKEHDIPWNVWGPLIRSESSFTQFVSAKDGGCRVIKNKIGAYCMTQVYMAVHPQYTHEELKNPVNCLNAGATIFKSHLHQAGGNYDRAVAYYKGIKQANYSDHSHWQLFKKYQQAGGFVDPTGYWISWN